MQNQESNGTPTHNGFGAQPWWPDPGGTLMGTIVCNYERVHEGRTVPVCRVLNEDRELFDVWVERVVLVSEFKRLNPQPGDSIAIKYLGKHPEKLYRMFKAIVQRSSDSRINWNDVQANQTPEPTESTA